MATIQNITKSPLLKQLFGAAVGMTIAVAVYMVMQQFSLSSIRGILVDSSVISENAHQVRVNDKTINDQTLRKISQHAQFVARQLVDGGSVASSIPAIVQRADERREKRMFALAQESAPTYQVNAYYPVTQEQRQVIRALGNVVRQSSMSSSVPAITAADMRRADRLAESIQSSVASPQNGLHSGAPAYSAEHSTSLPNSGFGLNVIIIFALAMTLLSVRPDLLKRIIALLRVAH